MSASPLPRSARSTTLTILVSMDEDGIGVTSRTSGPYLWNVGEVTRVVDAIVENLMDRLYGREGSTERTVLYDRVSGVEIVVPGERPKEKR